MKTTAWISWRLSFICWKDPNALNKVQVRPTLLEKLKNGGSPVSFGFTRAKPIITTFIIFVCECTRSARVREKNGQVHVYVCEIVGEGGGGVLGHCVLVHACLYNCIHA